VGRYFLLYAGVGSLFSYLTDFVGTNSHELTVSAFGRTSTYLRVKILQDSFMRARGEIIANWRLMSSVAVDALYYVITK
jgi:hypothetical protein